MKLRLPEPSRIVLTSETDPIERHYQPFVRYFLNKRLTMALELLGTRRFQRVLDAGYGGGVFLPELAQRARELHGVDLHPHADRVMEMARAEGIRVELHQASLCDTKFPDGYFDCAVCVSVLEFVEDVAGAIAEFCRIVRPGGLVIVGVPGDNLITNAGYVLARTPDPRRVHRANYRAILSEAAHRLKLSRLLRFPAWCPDRLALYFCGAFER